MKLLFTACVKNILDSNKHSASYSTDHAVMHARMYVLYPLR